MVTPRLIHKVVHTVWPIDHAATAYDDDLSEPVQTTSLGEPFDIEGQPEYRSSAYGQPGAGIAVHTTAGRQEDEIASITMRQRDIDAAGWIPTNGDRITQSGHRSVDLKVVATQPIGHYAANGSTLVRVIVEDRAPRK